MLLGGMLMVKTGVSDRQQVHGWAVKQAFGFYIKHAYCG
jgi:hypothetical protein